MMLLAILLSCLISSSSAFSCKDQHDFDVPWFAAYKMPKGILGDAVGSKYGVGFYYLDSNDRTSLKPSAVMINESHQAIGYTLNQYYSDRLDGDLLHLFYNDEPVKSLLPKVEETSEKSVEHGHTKGVLLFDRKSGTGLWLVHSVPLFPDPNFWTYPDSGAKFGQTFLCMTLDVSELKLLGTVLYYNHAWVYDYNMPDWANDISPDLAKVVKGKYNADPFDTSLKEGLKIANAVDNTPFTVFAKTHLLDDDLWAKLVAPEYGSLDVETWRDGHLIDMDCLTKDVVYDAQTIQVGQSAEFKYTKDHSKYARTVSQDAGVVCIGDINRMTSQYKRGGGTVCVKEPNLWKAWSVFKQLPNCDFPQ